MSENYMDYYRELLLRMREIYHIYDCLSFLGWDIKTYMPSAGIRQRAEGMAVLESIAHSKFVSPEIGKLLDKIIAADPDDPIVRRNCELWKRDYDKEVKVPEDLVKKLTEQQNKTEHLWEKAKARSDFGMVRGELEKLYELVKKRAEYMNPDADVYDVLLDIYEPKLTAERVKSYFDPLKKGVKKIIDKCLSECGMPDDRILKVAVPKEAQKKISAMIIRLLGLDRERSRLDESEHPFTTGYADDVRITTHYLEDDPMGSFYSVMHEGGHALYELGLPREHLWTAIGQAISLGVHESQSRFVENIIGKSPHFLKFIYPEIIRYVPTYADLGVEKFIKAVNTVKPDKIRIYADEVTYNLHVILRFELESALFSEKLTIAELPAAWNNKMEELLGVKVENDREGVLQDTHWYGGMFGYFPTYVLGNIYGGQILAKIRTVFSDFDGMLSEGNINPILGWLAENIHAKGSLYDPLELIENVTGNPPDSRYFVNYLTKKFGEIYGFGG